MHRSTVTFLRQRALIPLAVLFAASVALPQAQQRLTECADPSLNCDLEREPDAQPGE